MMRLKMWKKPYFQCLKQNYHQVFFLGIFSKLKRVFKENYPLPGRGNAAIEFVIQKYSFPGKFDPSFASQPGIGIYV